LNANSRNGVYAEEEEAERIKKARKEIEKKLAQRVTEVFSADVTESSVDVESYGNSDSERVGVVEESALARLRRERSEGALLRTGEDDDVEMRSGDGSDFEYVAPHMEVSGSERLVHDCWEYTRF
jgi:hypothetical protein